MRNVSLANLKRAVRNPRLFVREGHRLLSWPLHRINAYYLDRTLPEASDVLDRDWDTLVILDACRYDYFESHNWIPGDLDPTVVDGNRSWEFMQNNFVGRQAHDTVYVTANPYADQIPDETFHYVDYLTDRWNAEIGTVFPEDVREAAIEANREYPNKRLIVHFMQPHRPYLGPTAEELRSRIDLKGFRNEGDGLQIWGAAKQKDVTVEEIRRAYAESLDTVLEEAEALVEALDGKTVITADHGEMLGERVFPVTSRVWGHSEGFSTRKLRTVPWLSIESDERREITTDAPETSEELQDDSVSERLEALGYRE
jgi:hypothetical protein